MKIPTPYPKKIDPKEVLYYHFKIDPTTYVLFDSELNTPIIYGSYNLVSATVTNLPKTAKIFYFEIDTRTGWKWKQTFTPTKKTVSDAGKKAAVENSKANQNNG